MIRNLLTLSLCLVLGSNCFAQLSAERLLTENQADPISIDAKTPRFSWQMEAGNTKNVLQSAYQIRVYTADDNKLIWNSNKVADSQSIYVPYKGPALTSRTAYVWQVMIWDNKGHASPWSKKATWRMGMLSPTDWKAMWIGPGYAGDMVDKPSSMFRKGITLKKTVKSAFAYITAHGLYEAQINGAKIGDAYLTPGWTSYHKRLQYQVYDVTKMLVKGENAIGAKVGSGWYRSTLVSSPNHYGKDVGLLFQLEVAYTDGTHETIVSDGSWKSATGELRYAEIYNGATIDARMEQKDWAKPGFDDSRWTAVKVQDYGKENFIATYNEPVKKHETFRALKVITTPKGEKVIDFGQNLVGWVRLNANGKAGDSIKISHTEVLDKAGNFYTENLRGAKAQNVYILKGGGNEYFEPQFTWQGFRYIKVEGVRGDLNLDNFTAVAVYSDMEPTGVFTTSNPMLNQLQHNIQWGQKGNFLDVPTDCPQRDERLGWTGDAQVFSRTASFNMNVHNFFTKWLKDVAADQNSDGSVPHIIPDVFDGQNGGATGWSDVATVVPWNMYLAYGDKELLQNQYPNMKAWVDYMQKHSKNNLWNTGWHFGDWLFYSVENDLDGMSAITSKYLIAQCFYAYSTQLLINAATALGNKADADHYTILLQQIKAAYLNEYVTPNGLISSDTQTAYTLALAFDMLPDNLREQAAGRLAANIARYDNHLTTGFLGTPYLCHALSRFGYADVAYKLLLQDTYPSWLYPIKMGATTIWERWDGIKPDGSFETPTMNSYNHYAYGAIGDWMYRVTSGIDTDPYAPGYKKIIIKPTVGGKLTYANASYQTPYGKLVSNWKIEGDTFNLDVEVPANTTATVYVPDYNEKEGYRTEHIGSGSYHFISKSFINPVNHTKP
ncbi:family 78 glycoside hydrolase catalytic domain [Mucilaginibacter sp. 14171R-50]|uniref:glycoside hydrolase family 78 protein n=1 Tax=Mucilaginibacter sp. 14171R-50 TaxID=2703789 RepID=UPI00138B9C82|nr:glycoside hydrolase family 78 protein [Mucilaginibacter sp. 14171R-50]QHS57518.1 family 78 glycoside hydrolase catalytic domain [Mucilaginibacter sp. 14171R-50]